MLEELVGGEMGVHLLLDAVKGVAQIDPGAIGGCAIRSWLEVLAADNPPRGYRNEIPAKLTTLWSSMFHCW
ncbi:MAG: hypothetical protein HY040_25895 [Planctomycetes bacterium]|nr:hypothetical protein [Planctomycetota bacterium]